MAYEKSQATPFFSLVITVLVISLTSVGTLTAASAPRTVAEIALYQGPDREKLLLEGARKEGQLNFYTSNASMSTLIPAAFEKKYPFVKVQVGRAQGPELIKRVMEEHAAGRTVCDVIEMNDASIRIVHREGLFQEFHTPEAAYYKDDVKMKGKTGVYYLGDREVYNALGFNTEVIPPATAPKELKDLLDPRWKGKISMVSSSTGVSWIGSILESMGRDYVEKLSRQDIKVYDIQAAAVITLIVSGEAPMSTTAGENNIHQAKRKGAPVEWRPLDSTVTNIGLSGMPIKAPHPYAALLFLDFVHSREAQQLLVDNLESSPRTDISSSAKDFKKDYMGLKYPVDEYEKKFEEWQNILRTLFMRKR